MQNQFPTVLRYIEARENRRYRKTLFLRPSGGHGSSILSASPWLPDGFSICFLTEHVQFGGGYRTGPTRVYHVEQKEVGKEYQPSAIGPAQRLIVAVQFTVSEKVCQSCGHPLFSKVSEVNGDPS
jgi:hypothetical protein